MTVGELRALLAALPDGARVVVDGPDQCGYDVPKVSGVVVEVSGMRGRIPGEFISALGNEPGAFAAVCISGDPIDSEDSYAAACRALKAGR